MLPIGAKDVAVLIGASLLAIGGWTARGWYEDSQDFAAAQAIERSREVMRELAQEVATKTETAIGEIKVQNRTVFNEATKEVIRETVYRDCAIPKDGIELLNNARSGERK